MGTPRWRWVGVLAAGGALLFGLIGLAHTEVGRPLLWLLPSPRGACPVGADLTPAARDAARAQALSAIRGDVAAADRQALGFALGETHRDDVTAWAATHSLTCEEDRTARLHCTQVPGEALGRGPDGGVAELMLRFDAADRLTSVVGSQPDLSAEEAATRLADLSAQLVARSGPWTHQRGEPSAAWLAAGALNQAAYEFAFSDYNAVLAATNMGQGRVALRQTYQTLD